MWTLIILNGWNNSFFWIQNQKRDGGKSINFLADKSWVEGCGTSVWLQWKGFVMLLPGVRRTYPPLQWKLWTSLGFSHMDMILQADAKVDLKEREPRQAYLFLLSNSDQLSGPTSQEERVSWRKWDRKCYSGLAPSTWKLEAKKARFPTGFFQEISSGVSVKCKLPEVRSHISSCASPHGT